MSDHIVLGIDLFSHVGFEAASRVDIDRFDAPPTAGRVRTSPGLQLRSPRWMDEARCAGRSLTRIELRAECKRCVVAQDCLEYAVHHGIAFDVWGGYTPEERKRAFPEVDTNSVNSNRTGLVYVVQMGGYVKAGFTSSTLKKRLKGVRQHHPESNHRKPEVILHAQPGSFADERHLHADLALFRADIPGQQEWYRWCPELVEVVALLARRVAA